MKKLRKCSIVGYPNIVVWYNITSSMVWLVIPIFYGKVGYTEVVWYGRMLSGNIV